MRRPTVEFRSGFTSRKAEFGKGSLSSLMYLSWAGQRVVSAGPQTRHQVSNTHSGRRRNLHRRPGVNSLAWQGDRTGVEAGAVSDPGRTIPRRPCELRRSRPGGFGSGNSGARRQASRYLGEKSYIHPVLSRRGKIPHDSPGRSTPRDDRFQWTTGLRHYIGNQRLIIGTSFGKEDSTCRP